MAAVKNQTAFSVARYELINIQGTDDTSLLKRLVDDLTGGTNAIVSGADTPMSLIFPAGGTFSGEYNFPTSEISANQFQVVAVLETRSTMLPINVPMGVDQSWRIRFEMDMRETILDTDGITSITNPSFGWFKVNIGTRNQILDDGTITLTQLADGIQGTAARTPGELNSIYFENVVTTNATATFTKRVKKKGQGWFKREGKTDPSIAPTYPMSYRLTVVPHGICLYMWDNASLDQNDDYSWFVAQRQVNNVSGLTPTSGKFPVHCLYECSRRSFGVDDMPVYFSTQLNQVEDDLITTVFDAGGTQYSVDSLDPNQMFWIVNPQDREDPEVDRLLTKGIYRFVVREFDIFKPWDIHKLATHHQIDSHAIMNPMEQLSVTPDNRFVITFPTGLTTQRFMYPNHEIDIIAFSSAEVVSQGANIPIDSYTPAVDVTDDRLYQGIYSTLPNGNGMRILVHVFGGTIPNENTDVSVV